MAFGDFISNMPVGAAIGAGRTIYDMVRGTKASNELNAQLEAYNQMLQASLMRDAGFYNDVVGRAGELDATLRAALAAMGPRSTINDADIDARHLALRDQYLGDIDQAAAIQASQGYARARERGMDMSTQFVDESSVRANAHALDRGRARNQAYADAITQLTGYDTLVNNNRANILGEYEKTLAAPIRLMQGMQSPTGNLSNIVSNAQTNATLGGQVTGALAKQLEEMFKTSVDKSTGKQTTLGDLWGRQ